MKQSLLSPSPMASPVYILLHVAAAKKVLSERFGKVS